MLEISFDNSDYLIQGKRLLQESGLKCMDGSGYRNVRVDSDDAKGVLKMLKKEKIRCGVSKARD